MKMSPAMKKAQANMLPGGIVGGGFLGSDERNLVDIIEEDEERMRHFGLGFDQVADRLLDLLEKGKRGLGEPIEIEDKWVVTTIEARGHLACPYEDGLYRKIAAEIRRKVGSDASLLVSVLSLHLMKTHHFLQGKGTPFRLDPEKINTLLSFTA